MTDEDFGKALSAAKDWLGYGKGLGVHSADRLIYRIASENASGNGFANHHMDVFQDLQSSVSDSIG
eukprot:CAMPEP_0116823410 /NCGR_PEP_ID=MMETSP0418-20121206/822_1 /TAXON_ID=1158023 /ORGANISM="Astrosyne radiata, Strain 13vi08-1A" /LENGTH=65 /DNA_ID=CAMNT_0004451659 /DNA_START=476 /DNA_END=669 /DNA_ORIENTATION=+